MKVNNLSLWSILILFSGIFLLSCDDDAPPIENEEEVIARVVLTFTPTAGGQALTFTYSDVPGANPVIEPIVLKENTVYRLDVDLLGPANEDIGAEVAAEGAEHMLFYGWTDNLFSNPAGDGNIDARENNAVNYIDFDVNQLPIGLVTNWTTANVEATPVTGTFGIILKHQPGSKTATSTVSTGTTDLEVVWPISIVE